DPHAAHHATNDNSNPRPAPNRQEGKRMMSALYRYAAMPFFEGVVKRRKTFHYWAELERSQWLPRSELEQRQIDSLRKLLAHATQHCDYYHREWGRRELNSDQIHTLDDYCRWPLITRDTIRAHRTEMRAAVPGLRMLSKATGGSSGVPLQFDLNME